jgi:glycosyltransferase involved in cell wall biosynthesis
MKNKPTHIVHIIADSSSVPYFQWFAEKAMKDDSIKFSFILLHKKKTGLFEKLDAFSCEKYWIYFDENKRGLSILKAIPKLSKLLKKINPDIVHSHLFDDSICTVFAAKMARLKAIVITKQDTAFHWYFAPKAVKFDRLINKLATCLIAVSNECRDFIINKERGNSNKIHLIHHGISIDKLSKATDTYKKELIDQFDLKNKIVIGNVARLIEWKGHKLLLDVAEIIVKKYPNIVFLFVGEGDIKHKLEEIISQKNLQKNIVFTGWVDRVKIPSLYSIMDIYIHAAKYEPFGFVIPEAMLNGVPVLSTKTGSALDAIEHKKNGYLVNYDSVEEFVDGIEFLLSNNKEEIGLKGRETAIKMFSFDLMYKKHLELYNSILFKNE